MVMEQVGVFFPLHCIALSSFTLQGTNSQTTLSSSHSFSSSQSLSSPSLSQLQKLHCPCSITLFSDDFFFLFTISLYPQTEESRVVGLILGFFWNFWVSRWSVIPPRFWVCSFSVARLVMEQVGIFFSSSLYCSIPKLKIAGLLV